MLELLHHARAGCHSDQAGAESSNALAKWTGFGPGAIWELSRGLRLQWAAHYGQYSMSILPEWFVALMVSVSSIIIVLLFMWLSDRRTRKRIAALYDRDNLRSEQWLAGDRKGLPPRLPDYFPYG